MATVRVVDLLARAQTLLQDDATHWALLELQDWLNDGYGEVVRLRPDANPVIGAFACAVGVRQRITSEFPEAFKVLDVVRNVAAASKKRAVRLVDRDKFADQKPDWYASKDSVDIQYFMVSKATPKDWLVYPPAAPGAELEVVFSQVPARHALSEVELGDSGTTETINLDDVYANALLDYILYRAHSKDTAVASSDRAILYRKSMTVSLVGDGQ